MRIVFIFFALFFFTSCATKVTSIKQDQDRTLGAERGYVLLGIQTNRDLRTILIDGPQKISLSSADIKKGTNYLLVDLDSGTYRIRSISFGNAMNSILKNKDYWSFEVAPNQISYVGHLEIVQRGFWIFLTHVELVNRSSEALEFLEDKYPNLLANRNITYGGPGSDFLFKYLASGSVE